MGRQQQRRRQQQRNRRQQRQQPAQSAANLGRWAILGGVAVILIVIVGLIFAATRQPSAAQIAASPTPVPTTPATLARAVDGIQCGQMEQLAYHIHQHITLIDHGKNVPLPTGIGMPGGELNATCYYWIHVHSFNPGVIHVESPLHKTFTLGNFFDIWKATASDANPPGDSYVTQLAAAAAKGQVTAFANGKRWISGYRSIPLQEHEVITIEIGQPVLPPKPYTDWGNL